MNKTSLVLLAAGLTAGSAGGYLIGQRLGLREVVQERDRLLAQLDNAQAGKTQPPAVAEKGGKKADGAAPPPSGTIPPPPGYENMSLEQILDAAGPMERFQAIMAYVQRIPKDRIEPTLKMLRQKMQGRFDPETMFATHMLFTKYGTDDPKAAMTYLKTLDMFGQGFGMATVLGSMATKDPRAAAEFFKDENNPILNVPQSAGMIAGSVAREWAKQDPAAAMAWATSLKDGLRGGAISSIVGSIAASDPVAASKMLADLKLEKGDDRNRVFGQVAQAWATRDPEAALTWAGSLGDGPEKDEARRKALDSWANDNPQAAAAHLDSITDPKERDKMLSAVTGPWARRDPAGTAAWLQNQPESKGREESMRSVMWMWTATDPTAASTWLNNQPAGASKDEGIVTLANQTFATDPEAALTWAATIQDSAKRTTQIRRGIEGWIKKDESAAKTWLQKNPTALPAEDMARFN